ncbi:NIPSNAP protein [Tistlia consotensis]|uniref:NIPSNAP protein n=1 Tax=Tistlia consotensis USBA 355 TaxID=560819 RepID=A0A1Y6C4G9_9PROT|nr:NIPSNAP family protein [Tistlia consotensis]SMF36441.1 NIPSNAP protein [Tistlia consotensis USBA 355]SNR71908.1 NIPSNAP protein [Tistlia consotensis]
MIVEERIYRIRAGMMQTYLELVRSEGLAIQQPVLGNLIGYFVTEIGPLNHVVHLWGYRDLEDRAARRRELASKPEWQAFTKKLTATLEAMENRILQPTDFSPLQ